MASDGCAIGPDGNLLHESEIPWVHDPDDDEPMPAMTSLTVQRQLSATTLDSFVTKVPPACRSTCTTRPSTKVINPDNAMSIKCKQSDAPAPNPSCRLRQASPEHEEDMTTEPDTTEPDATEPDSSDCIDTEEDDPDDPGKAYRVAKALGDADRKVYAHCSSQIID